MMFLYLASVAGLVTFTQAILLPPAVSSADTDIINSLPFETKSGAAGRTLDLECNKCPVPVKPQNELKWVYDLESKLQLQFEVVENEIDALHLNGVQIYPSIDFLLEPLRAFQITQDSVTNNYTVFLRLGYELDITPIIKSDEDQLELIVIRLQIIEVASIFVDGLDNVLLKLIKTPSGKLMIGDLETGPTTNPGDRSCQTLVCKLKSIMTGKLSDSKTPKIGCGRKVASGKANPHDQSYGRHRTGHGAHSHHRHHGMARLFHALKRAAIHVLIPILIGIAAGFTASFLGMLVGQSAVFLWRTFYRRGCRGTCSKAGQREMETDKKDEESSFLEHQDPPPVYENVVENEKSAK